MGDLDSDEWREASEGYRQSRRQGCLFPLATFTALVFVFLPAFALQGFLPPLLRMGLLVSSGLVAVFCGLSSLGNGMALGEFRCPRCKKPFINYHGLIVWVGDQCVHCGLDLAPGGRLSKSPDDAMDG